MKFIALDLATTTGWAFFENSTLVKYGRFTVSPDSVDRKYPEKYIECAKKIGRNVSDLVQHYQVANVVIEETNISRFSARYSQKLLEFIHYATCERLIDCGVFPDYMNTSEWRKITGVALTSDEREQGRRLAAERTALKNKIYKEIYNLILRRESQIWVGDIKKLKAHVKKQAKAATLDKVRRLKRSPETKVTLKHVSVRRVNELYGASLILQDNDIADAVLLGRAYWYHRHGGKKR